MIVLTADSASELFTAACQAVLLNGKSAAPRNMATTEVVGAHLCLIHPRRRLVAVPPLRVINPAFAVAEALWILSGSDEPWIFEFNDKLRDYADGGILRGAYGPRIRRWAGRVDQLDEVIRTLSADRESRQSVIQIHDPARDYRGHRDVPCTLGYRFQIRDDRLVMHTSMRSQDLWLGFPYDIFTTTFLQELMAGWLGVEVGEYHHHVDSLHLYADDVAAATACLQHEPEVTEMTPIAVPRADLDRVLAQVISGQRVSFDHVQWHNLTQVLTSYRAWKAGDRETARRLADAIYGPLGAALIRWYQHLAPAAVSTGDAS